MFYTLLRLCNFIFVSWFKRFERRCLCLFHTKLVKTVQLNHNLHFQAYLDMKFALNHWCPLYGVVDVDMALDHYLIQFTYHPDSGKIPNKALNKSRSRPIVFIEHYIQSKSGQQDRCYDLFGAGAVVRSCFSSFVRLNELLNKQPC